MNENHIGSDFDEFLSEEGLLGEVEAVAVKRVLAYQISEMMKEQNMNKAEMARRMQTSRAALERLLAPRTGPLHCTPLTRQPALWANQGFHKVA